MGDYQSIIIHSQRLPSTCRNDNWNLRQEYNMYSPEKCSRNSACQQLSLSASWMSWTLIKGGTNSIDIFCCMHSSWLTRMHYISGRSWRMKHVNQSFDCFSIWYMFSWRKFEMSTKMTLHFYGEITLKNSSTENKRSTMNTRSWWLYAFDNKISSLKLCIQCASMLWTVLPTAS